MKTQQNIATTLTFFRTNIRDEEKTSNHLKASKQSHAKQYQLHVNYQNSSTILQHYTHCKLSDTFKGCDYGTAQGLPNHKCYRTTYYTNL